MKIKLLGIPILEITQHPFQYRPRPDEPEPGDPLCQPVKDLILPVTDGYQAASHRRKKDLAAIIARCKINIEKLQRTIYPNGSLGQMVKSAVNSRRALTREETQTQALAVATLDPQSPPDVTTSPAKPIEYTLDGLRTMTAQDLLDACDRHHKIDIDLALERFKVTEEEIVGTEFSIGSAGYRLREAVRMRAHRHQKKEEPAPAPDPTIPRPTTTKKALPTIQTPEAEELKELCAIPKSQLPRLPNGKLDVLGGLIMLNITDPRTLWKIKCPYGSALHLLKQVVGCTVGSGASIDFGNGITSADVKEVL